MKLGKSTAKASREREHQIVTNTIRRSEKGGLCGEERNKLSILQLELGLCVYGGGKGYRGFSPRKWSEKGEKGANYFFTLEKRNFQLASLCRLSTDNQVCDDEEHIKNNIKSIDDNIRNVCEIWGSAWQRFQMLQLFKGELISREGRVHV